jgi:hypothetical protein
MKQTPENIVDYASSSNWTVKQTLQALKNNGHFPERYTDLDGNFRYIINEICFWEPERRGGIWVIPKNFFLKDD